MNRRSLIKSLLPTMAGILVFKNSYGAYLRTKEHQTIYKGKNLCVITKSEMLERAKKLNIYIPFCKMDHHKSNIIEEMKYFVDQSLRYNFYNDLEKNIYGCCEGRRSKNGPLEIYFAVIASQYERESGVQPVCVSPSLTWQGTAFGTQGLHVYMPGFNHVWWNSGTLWAT
jgi:hypothetical protein